MTTWSMMTERGASAAVETLGLLQAGHQKQNPPPSSLRKRKTSGDFDHSIFRLSRQGVRRVMDEGGGPCALRCDQVNNYAAWSSSLSLCRKRLLRIDPESIFKMPQTPSRLKIPSALDPKNHSSASRKLLLRWR